MKQGKENENGRYRNRETNEKEGHGNQHTKKYATPTFKFQPRPTTPGRPHQHQWTKQGRQTHHAKFKLRSRSFKYAGS